MDSPAASIHGRGQLPLVTQAEFGLRHVGGEFERHPADGHGDGAGSVVDCSEPAGTVGIQRSHFLLFGIPVGRKLSGIISMQREIE